MTDKATIYCILLDTNQSFQEYYIFEKGFPEILVQLLIEEPRVTIMTENGKLVVKDMRIKYEADVQFIWEQVLGEITHSKNFPHGTASINSFVQFALQYLDEISGSS